MATKSKTTERSGTAWAYLRVSTDKQDTDRQELDLRKKADALGLTLARIVKETASGKKAERQLFEMVKEMASGDTLLVTEISRIARSMTLLNRLVGLAMDAGVWVEVNSPAMSIKPDKQDIPTMSMLFAFGLSAQIEAEMISDRTKSGLESARAKGVKLGRPKGKGILAAKKLEESKDKDAIEKALAAGAPVTLVARMAGVDVRTMRAMLKQRATTSKGGKDGRKRT
jgi:DNA invertase Pin-like site-specific DNA recombinase